jgi:hypothetical protein
MQFLITAGPTREYLDPVRYLSNASSGRMGCALAAAAKAAGHEVVLIFGPASVKPPAVDELVRVTSAADMFEAVVARFDGCDVFVSAAAVCDYRPAFREERKIKKTEGRITLELERTAALRLLVPPALVGALMGRGGATIRAFADDARASISVSPPGAPGPDRVVRVAGARAAVLRAVALLLARLAASPHYARFTNASVTYVGSGSGGGAGGGASGAAAGATRGPRARRGASGTPPPSTGATVVLGVPVAAPPPPPPTVAATTRAATARAAAEAAAAAVATDPRPSDGSEAGPPRPASADAAAAAAAALAAAAVAAAVATADAALGAGGHAKAGRAASKPTPAPAPATPAPGGEA